MSHASLQMDSLYSIGILAQFVEGEEEIDVSDGVIILLNKLAKNRLPGQVKNAIESYQELKTSRNDTLNLSGFGVELRRQLFRDVGFNRIIVSNLSFDLETTESMQKSLLEEVSLTRDLHLEGQRIISRGDLVTADRYLVLESFRIEYEKQMGDVTTFPLIRVGQLILILIIFGTLILYLKQFQPLILQSNQKITFILILVLLSVLAGSLIGKWPSFTVYLVPFIIVPVILRAFFNSRTAIFIHVITMLLVLLFE